MNFLEAVKAMKEGKGKDLRSEELKLIIFIDKEDKNIKQRKDGYEYCSNLFSSDDDALAAIEVTDWEIK